MYCLDELDRKKVKYPHLTDLAAGKIGRQEAAGTLLIIIKYRTKMISWVSYTI